jgi:peptide-methionine (S)-S-oxide reductase
MAETEYITLGGGCFWCTEAAFLELDGVQRVEPGYAGGHDPSPTYESVCSGRTGHAEVVRVGFDPDVLPLDALIEVFFTVHDPTTRDRQGADVGTQYRSVVLYENEEQERVARAVMERLQADGVWPDAFVTEVVPLTRFFPAESYHLDYYRRNVGQPYCQVVISPKLAKVRREFAHRIRGA